MISNLTYQLARQLHEDRLRAAGRRRTLVGQRPRSARTPGLPGR
jgi:hypothetical protein